VCPSKATLQQLNDPDDDNALLVKNSNDLSFSEGGI